MRSRVNGLPGRRRHWRAPGVVHRGIRLRTHRREPHLPSSRLMWALVIPRRASFRLVITTVFPWPPHGIHHAALALTDQASRCDKTRGRRPGLVAISSDLDPSKFPSAGSRPPVRGPTICHSVTVTAAHKADFGTRHALHCALRTYDFVFFHGSWLELDWLLGKILEVGMCRRCRRGGGEVWTSRLRHLLRGVVSGWVSSCRNEMW